LRRISASWHVENGTPLFAFAGDGRL